VARAKKTDRAEARRRARVAAAAEADAAAAGSTAEAKPATASTPTSGSARPGVGTVLRGSIRSVNLRQDIRDIPWLVTKTNAVWLPSLLILGATVLFAAGGSVLAGLPGIAFNLFVFPPPLASAFLAGILTDRMSYMAGLLVGLISALVFSGYVLVAQIPGSSLDLTERLSYVGYALAISPLAGLAIGGFAGFYRRFLRSANPPRRTQQPTRTKQTTKAAARR